MTEKKTEDVKARLTPTEKQIIEQLAKRYEGNESMALRAVIREAGTQAGLLSKQTTQEAAT